ncbi:MAG: IclR family transcriptional regulator [Deltaproteobacteria bacterium]|nr:IclR family transcriptional regulator [Deltaproteobacteria bacterium]
MALKKQYFSTSLEKGLKILSLFDTETRSLTQTEISRILSLNMTSTYRFVNTLVELGYLEKDAKTKEVRLGVRSLALSTNIIRSSDELRLIKQLVDQVYNQYNITIDVAFTVDDNLMRAYQREAKEMLTYHLPAVARNSLHNTSIGKAYLSTLSEDSLKEIVARIDFAAKTRKTIVDKNELFKEIEKTRDRGYAVCVEEYLPGLITIGAPLINLETGRGLGGVSFDFSIIQQNAQAMEEQYSSLIVQLARSISEVLKREDNEG